MQNHNTNRNNAQYSWEEEEEEDFEDATEDFFLQEEQEDRMVAVEYQKQKQKEERERVLLLHHLQEEEESNSRRHAGGRNVVVLDSCPPPEDRLLRPSPPLEGNPSSSASKSPVLQQDFQWLFTNKKEDHHHKKDEMDVMYEEEEEDEEVELAVMHRQAELRRNEEKKSAAASDRRHDDRKTQIEIRSSGTSVVNRIPSSHRIKQQEEVEEVKKQKKENKDIGGKEKRSVELVTDSVKRGSDNIQVNSSIGGAVEEEEDGTPPSSLAPPFSNNATAATMSLGEEDTTSNINDDGVKKKATTKKKKKKVIHLTYCKYPVFQELVKEFGFTIEQGNDEIERMDGFNFIWTDSVVPQVFPFPKIGKLQNWQRWNHFPSMHLITRKIHLALTLNRLRKVFPSHYSFAPKTWSLRIERANFTRHYAQAKPKIYIMKPNSGCQGKGIILSKDPLHAVDDLDNYIVQEYVTKPLLLEGKKFDLRVYVLITSVKYPSIFLYHDGLVRMCADSYAKPTDENIANGCMHFTNYAVNKHSEQFIFNEDAAKTDVGNKRDFGFLNKWLKESKGQSPQKVWERVEHMIVKTIFAAQPQLAHAYNSCFTMNGNDGFTCFEILGFDVLLDESFKPWVLEVNHSPSWGTDTPLDYNIKHALLSEAWNIVNVAGIDKVKVQQKEKLMVAKRLASSLQGKNHIGEESSSTTGLLCSPSSQMPGGKTAFGSPTVPPSSGATTLSAFPSGTNQQLAADIAARRATEDKKLKGFHRIFPVADETRMAMYEEIVEAAKELTSVQMTSSQEHRQAEVKQEREKREAAQQGEGKGNKKGIPQNKTGSSAQGLPSRKGASNIVGGDPESCSDDGCSGQQPPVQSSLHYETPPSRPMSPFPQFRPPNLASRQSHQRSSNGGKQISDSLCRRRSIDQTNKRDSSSSTSNLFGTSNATSSSVSRKPNGNNNGVMIGTGHKGGLTDAQRKRLDDQMEKHRQRMVLGPRMSVFQLRESQLDNEETTSGSLPTRPSETGQLQPMQQQQPGALLLGDNAPAITEFEEGEGATLRTYTWGRGGSGSVRQNVAEAQSSSSLLPFHQSVSKNDAVFLYPQLPTGSASLQPSEENSSSRAFERTDRLDCYKLPPTTPGGGLPKTPPIEASSNKMLLSGGLPNERISSSASPFIITEQQLQQQSLAMATGVAGTSPPHFNKNIVKKMMPRAGVHPNAQQEHHHMEQQKRGSYPLNPNSVYSQYYRQLCSAQEEQEREHYHRNNNKNLRCEGESRGVKTGSHPSSSVYEGMMDSQRAKLFFSKHASTPGEGDGDDIDCGASA